ncbi:hypothetical protein DQ04_10191020 [Trypanosoma grayi]|uniref:hypothetical protein n=1 Tax=Trypanosoma grayi TaxID=71804 RepID=UPI0004F45877|nr:hypothetical protein DQ04_10191020 [Trypanosoma grayi]KEG07319.1 hypothetical protein DQ04_10191020 [Trypanosoma grayi]
MCLPSHALCQVIPPTTGFFVTRARRMLTGTYSNRVLCFFFVWNFRLCFRPFPVFVFVGLCATSLLHCVAKTPVRTFIYVGCRIRHKRILWYAPLPKYGTCTLLYHGRDYYVSPLLPLHTEQLGQYNGAVHVTWERF